MDQLMTGRFQQVVLDGLLDSLRSNPNAGL